MTAQLGSVATDGWVRLALDVPAFRVEDFEPVLQRCQRAGVEITSLADLGDDPQNRRALYELNRQCSADIPGRGPFYSFDEYVQERLDVPSFTPAGVVVAVRGGTWVGMSATSDHREAGYMVNEMTGVTADARRTGLALAMKVTGIVWVRSCGVDTIRTVHHAANHRAIAMNRRLGYRDTEWDAS